MLKLLLLVVGAVAGVSLQLNLLAARPDESFPASLVYSRIGVGLVVGPLAILLLRKATEWLASKSGMSAETRRRFMQWDAWSYLLFLLPALGAFGVRVADRLETPMISAFVLMKIWALAMALPAEKRRDWFSSQQWLATLFFFSGFAALIYQIVWQRLLYSIYGINIESITVVVSIFMLGLGAGALVGGVLSKKYPERLPTIFLGVEVAIGVFGAISLPLIKGVGAATLRMSPFATSTVIFALLIIPTMLMGATLPALVAYLYRYYKHVGRSVGTLYFINTLGSATACFVTGHLLFVYGGMHSAVIIAAAFNVLTGILVFRYMQALKAKGEGAS